MSIRKIWVVILVCVSGCSQTLYNLPPGGTRQQFAADQAFCNAQSQTATGNTEGFAGLAIFKQNKEMCMEGKGYTKSDNVQPPPCNQKSWTSSGDCNSK